MRVAELWRYPVKSLAGERLRAVSVDPRGVEYDRQWALVDPEGGIASGKTTRRFRKVSGLLCHHSRVEHGLPVIALADGREARADDRLGQQLIAEIAPPGWALRRETSTPHFDAGAVHIVTTATLAALSDAFGEPVAVQRLRPNLLLEVPEGERFPEDGWIGRILAVGSVKLRIVGRTQRCVMVGHRQLGLDARPTLLKTIGRQNDVCAGVYGEVVTPGDVHEGDTAQLW